MKLQLSLKMILRIKRFECFKFELWALKILKLSAIGIETLNLQIILY